MSAFIIDYNLERHHPCIDDIKSEIFLRLLDIRIRPRSHHRTIHVLRVRI